MAGKLTYRVGVTLTVLPVLLLWGGLFLRDERLRVLLPIRQTA